MADSPFPVDVQRLRSSLVRQKQVRDCRIRSKVDSCVAGVTIDRVPRVMVMGGTAGLLAGGQIPVGLGLAQYRTRQVQAVTGLAGLAISV